ncbi:MAG: alpha-E domain-containing protein, partial [Bradyrhizobium sp.]
LIRTTLFSAGGLSVPVMEAVLEAGDSSMTYRSRYLASVQLAPVLDLLLSDETNPRSLAYQLAALVDHVENLPRDRTQPLRSPDQRIALAALHAVRMMTMADLGELPVQGRPTRLSRLLGMLAERLPRLSDLICHRYLIHAGVPKQMDE